MNDPLLTLGTGRCKCNGCGQYFSGVSSFDKHQGSDSHGANVCHDPAKRGLVYDGKYWSWPAPAAGDKPWGNSQDEPEGVGARDSMFAHQEVLL